MKTISLSVSETDYEAYRKVSRIQGRPIAQLLREAMAFYRVAKLDRGEALRDLPTLAGHKPLGPLPSREELYDDLFKESVE